MQKFLAGIVVGILLSALTVFAQKLASEKVVQPQVLVDNQKVTIARWVLKPGEGTPLHTHALDHVSVVIRGSTLRDVAVDGTAKENVQKAGDAVFVPGTGRTHSFANAGKETFESISIELK
jgi:quercetin dioxygenase-like cupin family protein